VVPEVKRLEKPQPLMVGPDGVVYRQVEEKAVSSGQ
jgi:hypothetical protein